METGQLIAEMEIIKAVVLRLYKLGKKSVLEKMSEGRYTEKLSGPEREEMRVQPISSYFP